MKLKYYLKGREKIYTLKEKSNNQESKDAHYKFIKIRDVQSKNID